MTVSCQACEATVAFRKKGNAATTPVRPAKITTTPGKIEIVSPDHKFPTVCLKACDVVKPKKPKGDSSCVHMDIVQNYDSKLAYVIFKVPTLADVDKLMEVLMFAWTTKAGGNALFADDADTLPVHVHSLPPNAPAKVGAAQSSTTAAVRHGRQRVEVDGEGSAAAHYEFKNDFKNGAQTKASKDETASKLQGMFDDYGIPTTNEHGARNSAGSATVHSTSTNAADRAEKATTAIPKHTKKEHSYAAQAKHALKDYRPVDKQRDGLGNSFYGGKTETNQRTTPSSALRMGTKESLDAGGIRQSRLPPLREEGRSPPVSRLNFDYMKDDDSLMPAKQKSLTSDTAIAAFDVMLPRKPSTSSSAPATLPTIRLPTFTKGIRPQQENGAASSSTTTTTTTSYAATSPPLPWSFKKQENIGNSCYMNATMQVLAACPIFIDDLERAFLSIQGDKSQNIRWFYSLMRWLSGRSGGAGARPVTKQLLENMRSMLMELDPIFAEGGGCLQQDAEECLTAVLTMVSEECAGVNSGESAIGKRRDSGARRSLGGAASPTKTPIKHIEGKREEQNRKKMKAVCDPVDLMEVKMRDVKRCDSCGDTNRMDAVEHRVHLGVEEEKEGSERAWAVKCVQQLLAAEVAQHETISDFKCEKCLQKCDAIGTRQFVEFGEYIIIVLKRFSFDASLRPRKLNTPVRVPLFLEVADLLEDGGRRAEQRNAEMIVLSSDKSVKRMKQKPIDKCEEALTGKTSEWLEDDETDAEVIADAVMESINEGKEEAEIAEIEEEIMKEANDGHDVIEIDSSQEDVADGAETAAVVSSMNLDDDDVEEVTPIVKGKCRLETPQTAMGETVERSNERKETKRADVMVTTPSRKRHLAKDREQRRSNDSSSSSLSSLSHSAPTIREKRSKLSDRLNMTVSHAAPPRKSARTEDAEECTIEDSDEEKEKRSPENKKPVWAVASEQRKENTSGDAYHFDDDECGVPTINKASKKRKGPSPLKLPAAKRPLTPSNEQDAPTPKDGAPSKRQARRSGEHAANKSAMEQTGGFKETGEDEGKKGAEREEKMEEDAVDEHEEKGDDRNVTRRSTARIVGINSRNEGEEKEEDAKDENDDMEYDISDWDSPSQGLELSIFESGMMADAQVDENIVDNEPNLFDLPPAELDQQKITIGVSLGAHDVENVEGLFAHADAGQVDGQVDPMEPPCLSPVLPDKREKKHDEALNAADVEEESPETNDMKDDEIRMQWRKRVVDTDAPPPRDHISFRPVDDRWMRGQCRLLRLSFSSYDSYLLEQMRAQSNLCKVTSAPAHSGTKDIDGDGNCLFRAISWWVTGKESNHDTMRKRIVDFMIKFPDEFGERMTGKGGQKYTQENVNRMYNDGEWGTQCEIYGAATLLGVDIYTFHESRWKPYRPLFEWTLTGGIKITRKTEVSERTRYGLYLTNEHNLHYDVVTYMKPEAPPSDTCYRLLGSIQHHGSTACSGHYIADVFDQEKAQWLHCDDSSVNKSSTIEVLKNAMNHGYVLIYGKNHRLNTKKKEESHKMTYSIIDQISEC